MSGQRMRRERLELAAALRADGCSWTEIADVLRERYGVNGRVACRESHGWSQEEAARRWNARWPDEPKTLKNISYWENWPSPTGYAPSLAVLDRLAQLYECRIVDLMAGWGDHRNPDERREAEQPGSDSAALARQARHLDVHKLAAVVARWVEVLPDADRQPALLNLGSAAVMAAARPLERAVGSAVPATGAARLAGRWSSRYEYPSSSRKADFVGVHDVDFRSERGILVGNSLPNPEGSRLTLELSVDGLLVNGSWTERTSPSGHYRGAIYGGLLQLMLDPTGHSMEGRWLGVGRRFTVKSGPWQFDRSSDPGLPDPQ